MVCTRRGALIRQRAAHPLGRPPQQAPSGGSIAAALCPAAELACVALPALSWLLLTRRSSSGTLVVLKDALSHRPEALRRLAALLCAF